MTNNSHVDDVWITDCKQLTDCGPKVCHGDGFFFSLICQICVRELLHLVISVLVSGEVML